MKNAEEEKEEEEERGEGRRRRENAFGAHQIPLAWFIITFTQMFSPFSPLADLTYVP